MSEFYLKKIEECQIQVFQTKVKTECEKKLDLLKLEKCTK